MPARFVGIDVGAERVHCVAIDGALVVDRAALFGSDEIDRLADWVEGAIAVAIDAPASLSTEPHRDNPLLSSKFARARCAEIALGHDFGIWVPWVTPTTRPAPGWMETGFAIYDQLRGQDGELIEVYPHAGYRELVRPRKLPKKTTAGGIRVRCQALQAVGVECANLEMWSHDGLDALLAAVIAQAWAAGRARAATCGHDGSAIWLPPAPT